MRLTLCVGSLQNEEPSDNVGYDVCRQLLRLLLKGFVAVSFFYQFLFICFLGTGLDPNQYYPVLICTFRILYTGYRYFNIVIRVLYLTVQKISFSDV